MAGISVVWCSARIDLISCIGWCAPNYWQAGEKRFLSAGGFGKACNVVS